MPQIKNTQTISLTKCQMEFLQLDCAFPAFFGGYGCGKSYLMSANAMFDAMHSASAVIGIYEPDYNLIRTVAVPYIERWLIEFGFTYNYNKQEHTLYTSSNQIGDFIFKSMDNPSVIVGYETYRSHVDELDTLTMDKAQEIWFKIMGRNRQRPEGVSSDHKKWSKKSKRMEHVNKISAYSTPEGFKFAYKTWVQDKNPECKYVKGRTQDNPELTDAYIEQLKANYPEALIKAYMEGEFVNLNSGTVYNCYDRKAHESFENIRTGEPLYIGCDFNITNCSATVWVKREGGQQWHAVHELTGVYDTFEMARILKERFIDKGHAVIMYPDASGHARKDNATSSSIAILKGVGCMIRAKSKNPDVRDRIAATNRAFSQGRLYVNSSNCPTVANCFEQQSYDNNGEPDKGHGLDHQNDASTYPIAYEMMITKPFYSVPIQWMTKNAS